MPSNNKVIGDKGELFICSQLFKENIVAILKPIHHRLIDIVATNNIGNKSLSIQVKTKDNKIGWRLSIKSTEPQNDDKLFMILVDLKSNPIDFYVFRHDEFVNRVNIEYDKYIRTPKRKGGGKKKDVGFRWFNKKWLNDEDKKMKNDWTLIKEALGIK